MSACKLSCVRKNKRQSADLSKVDGGQEVLEGCHSHRSTIRISIQPLPTTSLGQSTDNSSSTGVKGRCKTQSCPENCPKLSNTLEDKVMMIWRTAKGLWKKTNDPYHWQLLKSLTMFTLGLKLFNDLYRHFRNSCKQ